LKLLDALEDAGEDGAARLPLAGFVGLTQHLDGLSN